MTYLVEHHNQLTINKIGELITNGWQIEFVRRGLVVQILNAQPHKKGLLLFWRKHNQGELLSQFVRLEQTRTNFGGSRRWFVCPYCQRCCASIFDFGEVWWCRECGKLKYSSASGNKSDRILLRIDTLKARAKVSDNATFRSDYLYDSDKPKWMRWRTWSAIRDEHNHLVNQWLKHALAK